MGVAERVSARARGAAGWGGGGVYCVQVREYSCKLYLRVRLALHFYVRPARPSCMVMCNVRAVPSAVCGVCAGSGGQSAE